MTELPIVCTLQPGELNKRAAELLPGLVNRATRREPLESGVRFEFSADSQTLGALVSTIDAERMCCRFLRFQVVVEPDGGPIVLDITGPNGTREFLGALLESNQSQP